jgi:hypothetical protein
MSVDGWRGPGGCKCGDSAETAATRVFVRPEATSPLTGGTRVDLACLLAAKVGLPVVEAPQRGILTPPLLCVDSHKSWRPRRYSDPRVQAIKQFSGALNDIPKV